MPCFRGSQFKEKKFFRIHPHHPHQNLLKCPNIKGWRPVEGAPDPHLTLHNPHQTLVYQFIGVASTFCTFSSKKSVTSGLSVRRLRTESPTWTDGDFVLIACAYFVTRVAQKARPIDDECLVRVW